MAGGLGGSKSLLKWDCLQHVVAHQEAEGIFNVPQATDLRSSLQLKVSLQEFKWPLLSAGETVDHCLQLPFTATPFTGLIQMSSEMSELISGSKDCFFQERNEN